MLYNLFYRFSDIWIGFNVLKYISFRSIMAVVTGFLLSWFLIGKGIGLLKKSQLLQVTRDEKECPDLSDWHKTKQSTPTMGGIFILASLLITWLLWVDWTNPFLWVSIYALLHLGFLGLIDDLRKFKGKSARGVSKRTKLFNQAIVGLIIGAWILSQPWIPNEIFFPFFKRLAMNLGIFYVLWSAFVVTASSNAVNLTDGMDGLAIGCTAIVALTYAILAYITGNAKLATYLFVPYVPGAGEIAVICAGLFGVSLGYLWYNAYPAEVFMGDVGALALGGLIGALALFIKQEILLIIAGGVFVLEAMSVILQIGSFRLFGRRIFRVAPLHHHFQVKGRHEVKVIVRFWIISGLLALFALVTLKLR